jgi:hypothetical protein
MVKLTEVEDEHFSEKPATTKDDALLTNDDDDDYTDTGTSLGELCSTSATVQRLRMLSIAREQHKPPMAGQPMDYQGRSHLWAHCPKIEVVPRPPLFSVTI